MIQTVKGLRQVHGSDDRTQWRFLLIEAVCDFGRERQKSSRRRAVFGETMLERGFGEEGEDEGADKFFEEFGGRAEEGDGAIGGAKVRGFAGF